MIAASNQKGHDYFPSDMILHDDRGPHYQPIAPDGTARFEPLLDAS